MGTGLAAWDDASVTTRPEPPGFPVGSRVTVRQRLPRHSAAQTPRDGTPRDRFADVVGTLVSGPAGVGGGAGGPVVLREDGTRVPVRPDRVVAVRAIPPASRPARAFGPPVLDRLAAAHWPATETGALGDWQLRAAAGFTRRANSALAVGSPGTALPAALERVAVWYQARGLVPRVSTADAGVLAAAATAGWVPELTTVVLTARVADVLGAFDDGWADSGPPVRLDAAPDRAWLADYRDADRVPVAAAVLAAPAGTVGLFATTEFPVVSGRTRAAPERNRVAGGGLAGRGRAVVSSGWVGLSCIAVAPQLRRRGHARLLVAHLVDAALDAGAVRAYLHVETDNAPARALYAGLGFRPSHTTTYLRPR